MSRERKVHSDPMENSRLDPKVVNSVPVSRSDMADNWFLKLCSLLSWATAVAGGCAGMLDLWLLFSTQLNGGEFVLHMYGMMLAWGIVLLERENAVLLQMCTFLESWLLKGVFIIFVGTLLMSFEHEGSQLQDMWRSLVGVYLVVMGTLYFSLGALCFRQLKSHQLWKIRRKKLMKQEMQTLSAQKQEIEMLLADTETKLQHL